MHAVILAGGQGTRLRPLTHTRPKPLLPFAGDPFAAGLLRRLVAVGFNHATFLVGQDPAPFTPLRALGRDLGMAVEILAEPEPMDTAGAARDLLRDRDDGPFLVCNGDILTDLDYADLVQTHRDRGAVATLALTRVTDTSSFGVVEVGEDLRVLRFVEKPPPGTLAADTVNAGTYVLSPGAFDGVSQIGPLSFERAVFPTLVEMDATVLGIASDAYWADLGTPARYLAGQRSVLDGSCAWPLGDGFHRVGEQTLVHTSAEVAGARLEGPVTIGPRTRIGDGTVIRDSAVFEDVEIGPGATVAGALVGEGAVIAAGAQIIDAVIAPGTAVAD